MGIPVACSELPLPRVLLHVVFFFGYVGWLISCLFNAAGLGDLLDSSTDVSSPETDTDGDRDLGQYERFWSASMRTVIQEELPVARYEELAAAAAPGQHVGDSCAVCLLEYEAGDEVRRLRNCRHVYHHGCLGRWVEHGRSCPLCRAPLFSGEARWSMREPEESGADASYYDELVHESFSFFSSSASLQDQSLLLAHQFLSTSSDHW